MSSNGNLGSSTSINTGNTGDLRTVWTDAAGNTLAASFLYSSSTLPPTYNVTVTTLAAARCPRVWPTIKSWRAIGSLSGPTAFRSEPVYLPSGKPAPP